MEMKDEYYGIDELINEKKKLRLQNRHQVKTIILTGDIYFISIKL